jgi:hypothetical protein
MDDAEEQPAAAAVPGVRCSGLCHPKLWTSCLLVGCLLLRGPDLGTTSAATECSIFKIKAAVYHLVLVNFY